MKFFKTILFTSIGVGAFLFLLPIVLFPLMYIFWYFPYDSLFKTQKSTYSIQALDLKDSEELKDISYIEWIDDDNLHIGGHGDALIYNVNNHKIELEYSSLSFVEDFYWTKCMSKYGSIFMIKEQGDQNFKEIFVPNLKAPSVYNIIDDIGSEWWNTNSLDCKSIKYSEAKQEAKINYKGKDITFFPENSLLLTTHGGTNIYKIDNRTLLVTETDNKNNQIEIKLPKNFTRQDSLYSSYDELRNEYLWYSLKRRFAQDPNADVAKITAWRVSPDLKLLEEYSLPAGPWIYKDGYASCFSAGCSVYDRAHLEMKNGQIFAHVYGQGVKWKHKGIYQLNENYTEWMPIITGDTGKDFSVTPDGCKIAYSGAFPSFINRC